MDEAMASRELGVRSVNRTTWEFFSLLDILGRQSGRALVVDVHDDNAEVPSMVVDFAQKLCGTADIVNNLQQAERSKKEEKVPHLVFMLWSATRLKQLTHWHYMDYALWEVRHFLPSLPNALVLVMIHPGSQEQLKLAMKALRRMRCMLNAAWQLVVEIAVYDPSQPDGTLQAKQAACRALREVLNYHEAVSDEDPLIISLPDISFSCVPHKRAQPISKTSGK